MIEMLILFVQQYFKHSSVKKKQTERSLFYGNEQKENGERVPYLKNCFLLYRQIQWSIVGICRYNWFLPEKLLDFIELCRLSEFMGVGLKSVRRNPENFESSWQTLQVPCRNVLSECFWIYIQTKIYRYLCVVISDIIIYRIDVISYIMVRNTSEQTDGQ